MAVPSLEQFDTALAIAKEAISNDLIERLKTLMAENEGDCEELPEQLLSLIGEFSDPLKSGERLADAAMAFKWMENQPGYKSAEKTCVGRVRAQKMMGSVGAVASPYSRSGRAQLDKLFFPLHLIESCYRTRWSVRCLTALREYFYSGSGDAMYEALKRLDTREAELIGIADEINYLSVVFFGEARRDSVQKMLDQIQRLRKHPLTAEFQRSSKLARERLLVKRLKDANRSFFGGVKAAAIADMLTIEGVVNQVDLRTVQRWTRKPSLVDV